MGAMLNAQVEFTHDVALLILRAEELGYRAKGDQWKRSLEEQKRLVQQGQSRTMNSRHLLGLAIDLLLFKGDRYLTKTEEYRELGEWWENLRPGRNVWGGNFDGFPDGNHFERIPPA